MKPVCYHVLAGHSLVTDAYLRDLNEKFGEIIYGMPIIADKEVAYKETSMYKMNEIKPHTNWARKIYNRARAYGVIRDESGHVKLFAVNE